MEKRCMEADNVELKIKIKPPADCTEGGLQEWVLFHLGKQDRIHPNNPLISYNFDIRKTEIKNKSNGENIENK